MRARLPAGLLLAGLLATAALPVAAQGTLDGRLVTFRIAAWDDPAQPYIESPDKSATVGDGVEFGIESKVEMNGLHLVPVQIEIKSDRVEMTYVEGEGTFFDSAFNGFILRFDTDCALFSGWHVDAAETTLPVTDGDIRADKGALYINVSGMSYRTGSKLAVDLDVTDCPLS